MFGSTAAVLVLLALGQPAPPSAPGVSHTESCILGIGCCPTYDPNVDCYAGGHWHYNHCKTACT